jgi:hypothetical protein
MAGLQMNSLLEVWATWEPKGPPFVLDDDRALLTSARSAAACVSHASWSAACTASDFCAPKDGRLHLGLLPMPFIGDVRRASIYVLLLNPGLGPHDYYAEYEVPAFKSAVLANLRQDFSGTTERFLFLDPRFAWHGGFVWWHGKLAAVIERLASKWKVSFAEARKRLAAQLACIELFPYHSGNFRDRDGWLRKLRSVELARSFVDDFVMCRVQNGEAIVIVTRQVRAWNLRRHRGVKAYTGQQARAAHLSPDSLGGQAILAHLMAR